MAGLLDWLWEDQETTPPPSAGILGLDPRFYAQLIAQQQALQNKPPVSPIPPPTGYEQFGQSAPPASMQPVPANQLQMGNITPEMMAQLNSPTTPPSDTTPPSEGLLQNTLEQPAQRPPVTGGILSTSASKPIPDSDEVAFQKWYAGHASTLGINPNPDDPQHKYDYRAAYKAGAIPDASGHWPSQFKAPDHPNRYVNGVDTITGQSITSAPSTGLLRFQDKWQSPTSGVPQLPANRPPVIPQTGTPVSPQKLSAGILQTVATGKPEDKMKNMPIAMMLMSMGAGMLQSRGSFGEGLGRGLEGATKGLLTGAQMQYLQANAGRRDIDQLYKTLQVQEKLRGPQVVDLGGGVKGVMSGNRFSPIKSEKATPHGVTKWELPDGGIGLFSYEDYQQGKIPKGALPYEKEGKVTDIEQFNQDPEGWFNRRDAMAKIKERAKTKTEKKKIQNYYDESGTMRTGYWDEGQQKMIPVGGAKAPTPDQKARADILRQWADGGSEGTTPSQLITIRDTQTGQTKQITRKEAKELGIPGY